MLCCPSKPGAERAFEVAFAEAEEIIAGMVGFGRLALSRCVEQPGTYLLLVEWRRLEDHIEGFRGSPQYPEWRAGCCTTFTTRCPPSNISCRSTPSEPV
jgi:heme-degrading monooxygenase HmoA